MRLASFDLEIAKEVEGDDWQSQRPLGISCAATRTSDGTTKFYQDENQLTQLDATQLVFDLLDLVKDGYLITTVNGLGFDFSILAEESGMVEACSHLARNNCDLMLMSLCHFGWPVGLQALSEGAGIAGKLHEVALSDGTIITEMGGAMAPRLWAAGEYDAVLEYLGEDIRATLEVATTATDRGYLAWHSKRGKPYRVNLPRFVDGYRLPKVFEMMTWPKPDTSWMDNPLRVEDLSAWLSE
jgi:hypothetical protein